MEAMRALRIDDDLAGLAGRLQFRQVRDGKMAQFGEPAAEVLGVLINTRDFLHAEHDTEPQTLRRHGTAGRHLAALGWDLAHTSDAAVGIGGTGLCANGLDRQGEAGGERADRDETLSAGLIEAVLFSVIPSVEVLGGLE